jgi:hypothetical protein
MAPNTKPLRIIRTAHDSSSTTGEGARYQTEDGRWWRDERPGEGCSEMTAPPLAKTRVGNVLV